MVSEWEFSGGVLVGVGRCPLLRIASGYWKLPRARPRAVRRARRAGVFSGLNLPEPSQCVEAGQEAILASPCDNKLRQSFEAHGEWTLRKTKGICAATTSRDGISRGASSEEAAIVHPLRLDELELPPEIGSDKSKHQSPLHAIVLKNAIRKGWSIRGSTTDHPVDPNYARHF